MNVKTEFNNLEVAKQNKLIEGFKNAYGRRTHLDLLTNDLDVDFENYLWANILEVA